MIRASVQAVLCGSTQRLGRTTSAIFKHPVDGAHQVGPLGLVGDTQADWRIHGGADKAVHCYAWSHYAAWRRELPSCSAFDAPGAFGENLSVQGLEEQTVYVGDVWRVGQTILEVTQGRQPCFKLNLRFGVVDMAVRVQQTLRAGWYMRVIEPGLIAAGNRIELLERPHPEFSVATLLALIRDRSTDVEYLERVLKLPLTPSWRRLFERRIQSGEVEDWTRRMVGGD